MSPKRAAVIATGWVGDTIACTAAATSLHEERGFAVDFYTKWPQLVSLLQNDPRFRTRVYSDARWGRAMLWRGMQDYDLIVKEPSGWRYDEPFTCEIRRMAGCVPHPEYTLHLPAKTHTSAQRRRLAVARDIYKRAYGRDVDALLILLAEHFELTWVGLAPEKSSKRGRKLDLLPDAELIRQADGFLGPEGGLLWIAAGLGVKTVYFTEHIAHVAASTNRGDAWRALGSVNLFPQQGHVALPANCSNTEALALIRQAFE